MRGTTFPPLLFFRYGETIARKERRSTVSNVDDVLEMLARACSFTVSKQAHTVDPEVIRTFDRNRHGVSTNPFSAVPEFSDSEDRISGE